MAASADAKLPALPSKKNNCCGCGVCEAVCPVGAVSMTADSEGFMYPSVDAEKCIGCKKCERTCAFSCDREDPPGKSDPDIYAVRLKDREKLLASSSGGAFTALCEGWDSGIIACRYDHGESREKFDLFPDASGAKAASTSVYVQSFPDGIHKKAKQYLEADPERRLLFVGMGCQAAAFLKFAEESGFRDRVVVCDIICHGSPSPKLWKEYIAAQEKKHGGRVTYVTFKDKTNGWKKPTPYITINGINIEIRDYVRLFYSGCSLRPSCHVCPYASVDRNTDITIGDFWGIDKVHPDFYDPMGNSLVIIRTHQGRELFGKACAFLDTLKSDRESCLQKNLKEPTPASHEREKFWQTYEKGGIDALLKKYGQEKKRVRLKKFIKKLIGRK